MEESRSRPPPSLALDLDVSEVEGEGEGVYVSAVDAAGSGLSAVAGKLVRRVEPVPPGGGYYAVDGSHRVLEFSRITMVVSSVAVGYRDGCVLGATYPDSGSWPYIALRRLAPRGQPPEPLSAGPLPGGLPLVATRPLVDARSFLDLINVTNSRVRERLMSLTYGHGYSRQTMADENRTMLENSALEWCVRQGAHRIILDGPLYMIPGGLVAYFLRKSPLMGYPEIKRRFYMLAYLRIIADRAWLLAQALEQGAVVVSVVKRLSNSRILSRSLAYANVISSPSAKDVELVEYLVSKVSGGKPGVYSVGPILVALDAKSVLYRCTAPVAGTDSRTAPRRLGLPTFYQMAARHKPLYRDSVRFGDVERRLTIAYSVIAGVDDRQCGFLLKRAYYLYVRGVHGVTAMIRVEVPWHASEDGVVQAADEDGARSVISNAIRNYDTSRDEEVLGEVAYLLNWIQPGTVPSPLGLADKLAKCVAREVAWMVFQVLSRATTPTGETLVSMHAGEG